MIHRIHGRSLTEALQRAREELGEHALVLSQESLPSGAVTIAVSDSRTVTRGKKRVPVAEEPGIGDLRARLERSGTSRALSKYIVDAVRSSGVKGAYALDAAARAIGRVFRTHPSPKRDGRTRILAVVGPGGAGKTTTIAKIGRRLSDGGRSVLFTSLDGLGVGELEQRVAADADRHELPIHALSSTAEVDEARAVEMELDVILMDTPGLSVRDADGIERLAADLGRLGEHAAVEVHLVLPATHDAAAMELAIEAYAPVLDAVRRAGGAVACVVTKLDEAPRPAVALERCRRAKLALSFLGDGADARGHLRLARTDHLADLLLRGRLAG